MGLGSHVVEVATVALQRGDRILFYTDGITEAMNEGNELYGKHRLMEAVAACDGNSEALVKCLVASVEKFCDARPQRDDICVTAVRRTH